LEFYNFYRMPNLNTFLVPCHSCLFAKWNDIIISFLSNEMKRWVLNESIVQKRTIEAFCSVRYIAGHQLTMTDTKSEPSFWFDSLKVNNNIYTDICMHAYEEAGPSTPRDMKER
jgi:hypothetical protein